MKLGGIINSINSGGLNREQGAILIANEIDTKDYGDNLVEWLVNQEFDGTEDEDALLEKYAQEMKEREAKHLANRHASRIRKLNDEKAKLLARLAEINAKLAELQ